MALYNPRPISNRILQCYFLDVSNATVTFAIVPWKCKLVQLGIVTGNAITVGNNVVTCSRMRDGVATAITGGTITCLTSGSAAGNEYTAIPTADTYLNEGDAIKFDSDGGGTGVCPSQCYAIVDLMNN